MSSQVWSFSDGGKWSQAADHGLVSNPEHLDWAELLNAYGFASQPCCPCRSVSGFSVEIYAATDGGFLVALVDSMCRYWLILVDNLPSLLALFSSGLSELVGVSRGDLIDTFRQAL